MPSSTATLAISPEGLGHGFQIARAEAEQVVVARGPVRPVVPEREQQRAFEQKSIRMLGLAQAVEYALQRETDQHLIEVPPCALATLSRRARTGAATLFIRWPRDRGASRP